MDRYEIAAFEAAEKMEAEKVDSFDWHYWRSRRENFLAQSRTWSEYTNRRRVYVKP